jgi:hypothetical protein
MPPGAVERHAQSIVAALILAGVLWVGNILIDLRDRMSRAEEKDSAQTQLITGLSTQVQISLSDRYTSTDARREFGELYRRLELLDDKIDKVERDRMRR